MSMPFAIKSAGMISGVGLNSQSSCAAIRSAIDNFEETRFMDDGGEWILGSEVQLEQPWRGRKKLVKMAVRAITECVDGVKIPTENIPIFLCVAEKNRPGRFEGIDKILFEEIATELDMKFHEKSKIFSYGRVSGAAAMGEARKLLYQDGVSHCLIVGVDTLLVAQTLSEFEKHHRILTSNNSNGFIPGEAAAAILIGLPEQNNPEELICYGVGLGKEKAYLNSGEPLRADGLVQAIRNVMSDSGKTLKDVDFRITDISGEQYYFKEASLAILRILRDLKEE
ncbi:MAG: hypothetical protein OEM38_05540, partial [Gammaproteobacteria bacterium]|nr:hypothetical protein [Gammaproteobacteria bacterium]